MTFFFEQIMEIIHVKMPNHPASLYSKWSETRFQVLSHVTLASISKISHMNQSKSSFLFSKYIKRRRMTNMDVKYLELDEIDHYCHCKSQPDQASTVELRNTTSTWEAIYHCQNPLTKKNRLS